MSEAGISKHKESLEAGADFAAPKLIGAGLFFVGLALVVSLSALARAIGWDNVADAVDRSQVGLIIVWTVFALISWFALVLYKEHKRLVAKSDRGDHG